MAALSSELSRTPPPQRPLLMTFYTDRLVFGIRRDDPGSLVPIKRINFFSARLATLAGHAGRRIGVERRNKIESGIFRQVSHYGYAWL